MAYSKLFNQSSSLAEFLIFSLIRLFSVCCLYMCYLLVCSLVKVHVLDCPLVHPLVNWLPISWFIFLGSNLFQEALKCQNSQSTNDSYDDDQEACNHAFKTKRFACVIRTELGKWFVVIIESTLPAIFLHSDCVVVEKFQKWRMLLKCERQHVFGVSLGQGNDFTLLEFFSYPERVCR